MRLIKANHLAPELLNYAYLAWGCRRGVGKGELGVQNEDILNAIRSIRPGAFMTPLAQVIYMADYIERP